MLEDFKSHTALHFPSLLENRFLIACSGGLDSVVLTHLCDKSGINFALAHCNFELRGAESDTDEQFVKHLAEQLDKVYFSTHFNTLGYVNEQKVSVQMAARELRYAWFKEVMQKHEFKKVLTAHHLDDALETFLINLSRGTGIEGLTGIPENTETTVRPLLKYSRTQLLDYAEVNGLEWREDASNTDTKYLRNKIRLQLVPVLKELHPNFLENFKKSTNYLSQSSAIASNEIEGHRKELFIPENGLFKIPIARLKQLNPLEGYLYALFQEYGFSEWKNILDLLDTMSGKFVLSSTHKLVKNREFLWLSPLDIDANQSDTYNISADSRSIAAPISLEFSDVAQRNENAPDIIYVDKNALKYPLLVRKWKKGDYFYPLGFNGKKKLAKFFKDEKMPVSLKERQWLLCSGDEIVWIIGKRADERFKVQANTKDILRIEVNL